MARAARKRAAPASAQLGLLIGASSPAAAPAPSPCASAPAPVEAAIHLPPAPSAPPPVQRPQTLADVDPRYAPQPLAFGAWLLKQKERGGFVGDLAKAAVADRGFPKAGDPEEVRKRMETVGADGDMFEALEDAERAWLAAA